MGTGRNDALVPNVFEVARDTGVAKGFWEYYGVSPGSLSSAPQGKLVRFATDIQSFARLHGRILSVGCGFGLNEILLAYVAPQIKEIVCLDILDDLRTDVKIRSVAQIARGLGCVRIAPLLGDGGRLPFRDAVFECAIAIDSLSHADYVHQGMDLGESQRLVLQEMARVVKPRGVVLAVENNALSPLNLVRKHGSECHPVNPCFLKGILESRGFSGIRVVPHSGAGGQKGGSEATMVGTVRMPNSLGLFMSPFFMLKASKG